GRDPDYIANRKSLLNVWVRPVIGDLLVTNWDSHASLQVIDNARPNLSAARLQDLGSTLSGLRATAHRKRAGGRWLSPDEDPLEEVSYTKGSGKQGASSKWVPPHKRPDTDEATDWDTIADWSGHDVRTLLAYYVIPSEEATKRARGRLDRL
ncbi:MAG: hypothetical protein JWP46_3533, partial [Modestobacter sp.]|nr:hypothetical protein [Modestobacter sp.]